MAQEVTREAEYRLDDVWLGEKPTSCLICFYHEQFINRDNPKCFAFTPERPIGQAETSFPKWCPYVSEA